MRWFSRAKASRFPADMLQRLDRFGRYELDPQDSGVDSSDIWTGTVAPFWPQVRADRDGFLNDLTALVADDSGGFATYGAARLVWELCGEDAVTTPAAWPLVEAGIAFKRDRGLPTAALTGYEMRWLDQRRRAG